MGQFNPLRNDDEYGRSGARQILFSSTTLRPPSVGELTVGTSFARLSDGKAVAVGMSKETFGGLRACQWDNGIPRFLEAPDNSEGCAATLVNAGGSVIGYSKDKFVERRATGILWNSKGANVIEPLRGDDSTEPTSMNSKGLIVGMSYSSHVAIDRTAVIWFQLEPTALPLPRGAKYGQAMSINDSNVIVGSAFETGQDGYPVIWIKNRPVRLPDENGGGLAVKITNSNLVLGFRGSRKNNAMCVWDIRPLLDGGASADIVCVDIEATRSVEVKAQSATVVDREGKICFLFNASKQNGADVYHYPLYLSVNSLDELKTAKGHDLNDLVPDLFKDCKLHEGSLSADGVILAEGRPRGINTGVILVPAA